MIKIVRIPTNRIPILIGKKREVMRTIEKNLDVRIEINDEVTISGEDALAVMNAENVVRAIGRGFSPERAFKLLSEDMTLCIVPLPKNKRLLHRISSRLIGEKGRSRENLERLTGCDVSIYGKTVAIIGKPDAVEIARQAVEKLIAGASHGAVWSFVEKRMKEVVA
jgi:ribosomal RNA assembly protein